MPEIDSRIPVYVRIEPPLKWPLWFDDLAVLDLEEQAPISEDLKYECRELAARFVNSTAWCSREDCYFWLSPETFKSFIVAADKCCSRLIDELGEGYKVFAVTGAVSEDGHAFMTDGPSEQDSPNSWREHRCPSSDAFLAQRHPDHRIRIDVKVSNDPNIDWPLWFAHEDITDIEERAPISTGLKAECRALARNFAEKTNWCQTNGSYYWLSREAFLSYCDDAEKFRAKLIAELGEGYYVHPFTATVSDRGHAYLVQVRGHSAETMRWIDHSCPANPREN